MSSLSVLAPTDAASQVDCVRLAEVGLHRINISLKRFFQSKLGAALYRAGRFEDAIRQFEASRKEGNGSEDPVDWLFLAMANERLSRRDEALSCLEVLRNRQPSPDYTQCWNEMEISLLRSEAEALIVDDPAFPANTFGAERPTRARRPAALVAVPADKVERQG